MPVAYKTGSARILKGHGFASWMLHNTWLLVCKHINESHICSWTGLREFRFTCSAVGAAHFLRCTWRLVASRGQAVLPAWPYTASGLAGLYAGLQMQQLSSEDQHVAHAAWAIVFSGKFSAPGTCLGCAPGRESHLRPGYAGQVVA